MEPTFFNSAFDIFELRPVQSSVLETIEEPYNPVAGVDQSEVEFLVPANTQHVHKSQYQTARPR